jgi:hypothetical protein
MNKYSARSLNNLAECDTRLQRLFHTVLQIMDNSITCGHRGKEEQNTKFNEKLSKVKYPNSKHNTLPSRAVDAQPYPTGPDIRERATYFAGIVQGVAFCQGVVIIWGGDWDHDFETADNSFDDLWHFELADENLQPKDYHG